MKEKLYTIPLNDAVDANDECPLCFAERKIDRDLLDFTLGHAASYMESDIREMTDLEGFCRMHFKELYDYGNALGNGWILSTHIRRMKKQLDEEIAKHEPGKTPMFSRFRNKDTGPERTDTVAAWVAEKERSCYICRQKTETLNRYIDTFFHLWEKDDAFRDKIRKGKGFCLSHFGMLCEAAETKLPDRKKKEFYDIVFERMQTNLDRLTEDVDWLVKKFDHVYADADWKNSRDAIQRGMQKMKGGYPADEPHKMKK